MEHALVEAEIGYTPKWYGQPRADAIGDGKQHWEGWPKDRWGGGTAEGQAAVGEVEWVLYLASYLFRTLRERHKKGKGPRGALGHWTWGQRALCFYPCNLQQNGPGVGFADMLTLSKLFSFSDLEILLLVSLPCRKNSCYTGIHLSTKKKYKVLYFNKVPSRPLPGMSFTMALSWNLDK